jgi:hypothetical protein
VHQDGTLLTWFALATGARLADAVLQEHAPFVLVGLSQDGRRAVLARTQHRSTTFAVVSRTSQRDVELPGNRWRFVALSGERLFLVHDGRELRIATLPLGGLAPRLVALPGGAPFLHVASADGRFLYTLSVSASGRTSLELLDTQTAAVDVLALPGAGSASAARTYTLVLDPEARFLWAVSPGYGRVVHVDVTAHRIDDAYTFAAGRWNATPTVAVMAPDGERIALSDQTHVWFLELARRKVVAGQSHVALALGYAPDESRLWAIGERSRVSRLPAR